MTGPIKNDNTTFVTSTREGRKIILALPEKLLADFAIKLHHEGIPFRKFFRTMVEGFVQDDPNLLMFLEKAFREERPKYLMKVVEREKVETKEVEAKFGLDPNEIEDIYDILEEDLDDY